MKKYLFILNNFIIFSFILVNKPAFSENKSIIVATASNGQFAMDDLKKEFKKQTGIEIKPILNSSGKLTTQIKSCLLYTSRCV